MPVRGNKVFDDIYSFGELTSADYPTLVPKGESIDTVSVPTVLAVFNWPRNSDRYNRLQKFTNTLFEKWDRFQKAPFHPKWREVNLAADVPGWTRSPLAEAALKKYAPGASAGDHQAFDNFLAQSGGKSISADERERLFREFMTWRAQQTKR